ncbi:Bifunctional nitrilase/nitrile hydratase NIT4A [Daldinia childiae]|uniref:Bifunctional nitrilase/nitrile hydratase NIT4A n=1 Tax=Daldinia childiae TaxID=326645 RepID=UPI001446BA27|nr:Bifunctional nitrilase/nitrile hydratase NIT4A [Daldinia childiae]KAF3070800.1 Bifunctional nitrilase/nitrile hydratase NIT4A [Daldinia childiae]
MASTQIRLATASPGTQGTTKETIAQLQHIAQRAAVKKADILLLPEAYLGGYPRGSDFGCKIGSRTAEGRDDYLRYFKSAVDLGDTVGDGAGAGEAWVKRQLSVDVVVTGDAQGPVNRGDGTREEIERIARETGVFIVVGLVEKAGGSLYCSVIYVCPKLGAIGKRRKVQPTGTERLIWAQGSPATLKAVSTTIRGVRINLAAAICWENYMPLLRQSLYAQNVNLYLAPTADNRDAWLSLMRTVALEGRCFVVSSNMCVRGDPTADSVATPNHKHGVVAPHSDHQKGATGRRNSFMTEDGFEIALPLSPTSPSASGKPRMVSQGRRRSVFDEDGNEIALPEGDLTASAVVEEEEGEARVKPDSPALVKAPAALPSNSFVSRGGSSIVSPFGDVIAGPQWEDEEGIIYADVDFDDCIRGRLDLDAAGSYSRNDSFKFSVAGLDLDPLPYY